MWQLCSEPVMHLSTNVRVRLENNCTAETKVLGNLGIKKIGYKLFRIC